MRRMIVSLIPALLLLACAAPRTTVKTDDQSGRIRFRVHPSSAEVVVNGQELGKARRYDGTSAVLKLPAGTHTVVLKADGYEDYETKVYLSDTEELVEIKMRVKP